MGRTQPREPLGEDPPPVDSAPTAAAVSLMRAAVLRGPAEIEICDVPRPRPAPHEVLVRVLAVGLCGTDVHIYSGQGNYNYDSRGRRVPLAVQAQILGHEIAGVIEEVGQEVRELTEGQRVVIDQGRTCVGERRTPLCEYCTSGDSHQCESYQEHGITGLPGGFAEYIAVPEANAVPLETELDTAVATVTEPLGCVLHSSDLLSRTPARYQLAAASAERRIRTALVCGAGPSGLLFIQYLRKVLGFDGLLLASDPNPHKRAMAERFGAEAIDPFDTDLIDEIRARTGGRRVELLIEASGAGAVISQLPGLIRKQATVVLYGHGHAGVPFSDINGLQFMEPTLLTPAGASGGFEPNGRPSVFVHALRLIESGRIEIGALITHRYLSLASIAKALRDDHRLPDYVKGVVSLEHTAGVVATERSSGGDGAALP